VRRIGLFGPRRIFGPRRTRPTSLYAMAAVAAAAVAWVPATADSQPVSTISAVSLKSGQAVSPNRLETGDQAVIENESGALAFAGYDIALDNVSGAMGYSSAAGYVVVASGAATADGVTARAGEILILLPGGEGAIAQLYDARRYAGSWDASTADAHPAVYQQLNAVAGRQKWKLFFGRLTPTSFNIAAPGSADQESARRTVYGAESVRQLRFAHADDADLDRKVVEMFAEALLLGDVATVAALMDPAPFGGSDLRYGAEDARMLMAGNLLESADWQARLDDAGYQPIAGGEVWVIDNGIYRTGIVLRRDENISFVHAVNTGD